MARHDLKKCPGCSRLIPVDNFRGDVCASCVSIRERAAREARVHSAQRMREFRATKNPALPDADRPEEKVCIKCGRSLPLEEFPHNPKLRSGRDSRCRECINEQRSRRRHIKSRDDDGCAKAVSAAVNRCMTSAVQADAGVLPDLKACPFCGKAPKLQRVQVVSMVSWEIVCSCFDQASEDGLSRWIGMDFETPEQAAAFWNRRSKAKAAK